MAGTQRLLYMGILIFKEGEMVAGSTIMAAAEDPGCERLIMKVFRINSSAVVDS